jgi:hypothetical protein
MQAAESEPAQNARRADLHQNRPDRGRECERAGFERRAAEPDLEQEREQERRGPEPDSAETPAQDGDAEGRNAKQGQVERRGRHAPRMADI